MLWQELLVCTRLDWAEATHDQISIESSWYVDREGGHLEIAYVLFMDVMGY